MVGARRNVLRLLGGNLLLLLVVGVLVVGNGKMKWMVGGWARRDDGTLLGEERRGEEGRRRV